ncbi:MAG: hypothetical protein IPI39_15140 [Candidatus Obscuribacter sp.]|nr:hypothetical protein [Candidatus Obscuribacter sp.]
MDDFKYGDLVECIVTKKLPDKETGYKVTLKNEGFTNGVLVCREPLSIGELVIATFGDGNGTHIVLYADDYEIERLRSLHRKAETERETE